LTLFPSAFGFDWLFLFRHSGQIKINLAVLEVHPGNLDLQSIAKPVSATRQFPHQSMMRRVKLVIITL